MTGLYFIQKEDAPYFVRKIPFLEKQKSIKNDIITL